MTRSCASRPNGGGPRDHAPADPARAPPGPRRPRPGTRADDATSRCSAVSWSRCSLRESSRRPRAAGSCRRAPSSVGLGSARDEEDVSERRAPFRSGRPSTAIRRSMLRRHAHPVGIGARRPRGAARPVPSQSRGGDEGGRAGPSERRRCRTTGQARCAVPRLAGSRVGLPGRRRTSGGTAGEREEHASDDQRYEHDR